MGIFMKGSSIVLSGKRKKREAMERIEGEPSEIVDI